jgi:hypothetical protein
MYHVLGHFSKFLRPGHVRVSTRVRDDPLAVPLKGKKKAARKRRETDWPGIVSLAESETDFGKPTLVATSALDPQSGRLAVVILNTRDTDYKVVF